MGDSFTGMVNNSTARSVQFAVLSRVLKLPSKRAVDLLLKPTHVLCLDDFENSRPATMRAAGIDGEKHNEMMSGAQLTG